MKLRFFLQGMEIKEPTNYRETSIDVTFDKNQVTESVDINSWEFGVADERYSNDALLLIKEYIRKGLVGDPGVLEGMPYMIQIENEEGTVYNLFDGYIDVSSAKVAPAKIMAPAIEQGNLNWLSTRVDGFTFEYLYSIGKITRDDFLPIPYVINKKQHASETIIAIVTIFITANQLNKQILEYRQLVISLANPFEITAIARLALQILYIVTLVVALITLLFELYKALIQPVKYHYGMYVKDLLRIGFEHIGMQFQSSILNKHPFDKLVILPEKFNIQENNKGIFKNVVGNLKVNTNEKVGFYKGDFGRLLSQMITFFHAKTGVDNGTYYLEKQNYNLSTPKFVIPPVEDSGYEFNADQFISNFLLTFLTDPSDRNTIQEFTGTSVQIIVEPKVVSNKKMVLTKGLDYTTFEFALGKRKTEFNYLEGLIDDFFKDLVNLIKQITIVINQVIGMVNGVISKINFLIKKLRVININININIPSLPKVKVPEIVNQIDGTRKNMLKMESDFVNVPKLLLIERKANPRNNVLIPGAENILSAKYMWENFHRFKSFAVQADGSHNQYLIYNFENIPFTFENYEQVRRSREIFNPDNEKGFVENFKFFPIKGTCSGRYKINKLYTNNLIERIIEPDGK